MKIKQLSTSACQSTFDVDGHELRLWIITGGTPALAFTDYSFDRRYPSLPEWSNTHYHNKNGKSWYDHQDPDNVQGPTFDVLPNGLQDVEQFLRDNVPLRELRQARINGLPYRSRFVSRKVRDKEEHTLVHCELNLTRAYVPPVIFLSKAYAGRCDGKIVLFDEWWKKTQSLFNTLCDTNKTWESLSDKEYDTLVKHLKEYGNDSPNGISNESLEILAADDYEEYGDDPA